MGQSIPAGLLVTVPSADPDVVAVRLTSARAKLAVTETWALTSMLHVPVPLHGPLQP